MKKSWILVGVVVIILGIIFIPKMFSEGDEKVKFRVVEKAEVPTNITENISEYWSQERALAWKVNNEIYVVVTRGEMKTSGYLVSIDKIKKVKKDNAFELVVYAKYKDPKPGQISAPVITYPTAVVITELEELPIKVKLEKEYID